MYYTDGFPKSDLRQFIANDDCVDGVPAYESPNCLTQLWSVVTGLGRRRRAGYDQLDGSVGDEERPILA